MKKLFLLSLTAICVGACMQNSKNPGTSKNLEQDSIEYILKSIEFIHQVEEKKVNNSSFILGDRPFAFNYYHCLEELLKDTGFYSIEELNLIKHKKYPSLTKWTKELFPVNKIISTDSVTTIFNEHGLNGWSFFYKQFGSEINNFSMPIFLRNYTYCIFYSDNICGGLCGGGRLVLYKKTNEKWEEVKTYCNWMS